MTAPISTAQPAVTPPAQPPAQESFAEIWPTDYAANYILTVMKELGMPVAMIKGKVSEAVKTMASKNGVYLCKMHGASVQYMQNSNADNRTMRVNVGVKKIPGMADPVNPNVPKPGVGI